MARNPSRQSKNQEKEAVTESKKPTLAAGPFDLDTVRNLVNLMKEHELWEIELGDEGRSLKLRRGAPSGHAPVISVPVSHSAAKESPIPPREPAAPSKKLLEIKSPTPGTYYSQEKPGSKPYAEVGTKITPNSVVCVIEAMKIFNEIQAEITGTIVEILVENKQPVEYGQVLFRVDPS